MITPSRARREIERAGVPYGQDVTVSDDIDTSECQEYFGIRCPENVHVKSNRIAHIDRVDPRVSELGHLKKDVGISYAKSGATLGASAGALLFPRNRAAGALFGGLIGGFLGSLKDDAESNRF